MARTLGLPTVVTEQYPKGLGPTVPEVAEHIHGVEPIEKTVFSAVRAQGFDLGSRDQALVCGIETHVCVWQTASDLLDRGVEVHVARDAVTSRTEENRELGLRPDGGRGRGGDQRGDRRCSSCSAARARPSSRPSRG